MKKRLLKILLGFLGLVLVLLVLLVAAFRVANHTNGSLISAGVNRKYLLYVPESYNPSKPAPLVVSIHGYAEWPAHQMQVSGWNSLADQYGFIVVYPSGTDFPMRWRLARDPEQADGPMVDVQFISDLIDTLDQAYNVDPERIYANGLSNGGGMSFVLACELSERIAAIGSVSGAYLFPWEECNPTRPVPAILFHGTQDPIVPYEGGPSQMFDLPFPVISEWAGTLANRYGCSGTPVEVQQTEHVRRVEYTACQADVTFYTIAEGGHTWPGGEALPEWIAGTTTDEINATQLMWDFFQEHPMMK